MSGRPAGSPPVPSSPEQVEIGGAIRRVGIVMTQLEPCGCYLARRLRGSSAQIFLINQVRRKIEPDSFAYYRRLLERRGVLAAADCFALFALREVARTALWAQRAVLRLLGVLGGTRGAEGTNRPGRPIRGPSDAPVLQPDPEIAHEDWLNYIEVTDINQGGDQERVASADLDLLLLAGAPILSRRTIGLARVACLNPHCGITPDYAGGAPFTWAVYERRFADVGYTIHAVVPQVDSGPILHQERVPWDPERETGQLWPLLAQRMYDKLADIALALVRGERFLARPQPPCRVMPPAGLVVRAVAEWRRIRYARSLRRG